MINTTFAGMAFATLTAIVGMVGISVSMIGYGIRPTNKVQRILFLVSGLLLIDPGLMTDAAGAILLVALFGWQKMQNKNDAAKQA